MNLPQVTEKPQQHGDCCLGISTALLDALTRAFHTSAPTFHVISIGSGSGLLEALLLAKWVSSEQSQNLTIEGIEVCSTSDTGLNRYLPEDCSTTVRGTWEVSLRAQQAGSLLFVYPRDPELISRYLQFCVNSNNLRSIVWLGPKADWENFSHCFVDIPGFDPAETIEENGLVDYEMMTVIRKTGRR